MSRSLSLLVIALTAPLPAQVLHWAGFRGTAHNGVASAQARPPVKWSAEENIAWKKELPGPGSSSPILVGDRVLVYCYSGYGDYLDDGGEPKNLMHHLVSFDRNTGEEKWTQAIAGPLEKAARRMQLSQHGFASPTPVCDGKTVFVYMGRAGVVAFDLDGKKLWQTDLGHPGADSKAATNRVSQRGQVLSLRWGAAASPVLFENLVIVNCAEESNSIRALNRKTGKLVWKRESPNLEGSVTPPMVAGTGADAVIVVTLAGEVWGLDPKTGALLWTVETESRGGLSPMPVTDGKLVYVFGGSGKSKAIQFSRDFKAAKSDVGDARKPTEKKTVTDANEEIIVAKSPRVVWESENLGIPSPVLHGGQLFLVRSNGFGVCMSAKDGEVSHNARLDGRTSSVYASPVWADGKLYVVSRKRGTFIYSADGEFKLLGRNELEDDSQFNASPAIAGKQLFLRSDKVLYCIAKK
jgi:outer membrane protein assembly factor BamB